MFLDDIIAAIATPIGHSGIGVVRVSGSGSYEITKKLLATDKITPNMAYHARLNGIRDDVIVIFFKSPTSYTGEDSLEISCHGNPIILNNVLSLLFEMGARQAHGGEFTKRSFMNGKIDLVQAEAVQGLIEAQSAEMVKIASSHLFGALSLEINGIKAECLGLIAHMQAAIDFPDDVSMVAGLIEGAAEILLKIDFLLSTAQYGRLMRSGIKVAILGKPNVGKSSLLNALIGSQRAIVTDIPGTTRDSIIEAVNVNGLIINFIDTAGIRDAENMAEELSIGETRRVAESSDIILAVLDGSSELNNLDLEIMAYIQGKNSLLVINKCDLRVLLDGKGLQVSAKTGYGIQGLKNAIYDRFIGKNNAPDFALTSERQINCLRMAKSSLQRIVRRDKIDHDLEMVSADMQEALAALDEMLGTGLGDDLIDRIFVDFCVGK
ncbi:tRNA uridine-5-carboxymethylaminomethyl(34) synthesis GTPase MnmE [Candidatus Saganbacteria bacterium]|nr:tRNA uridine-5-carboxymethylaminomethyl(34) synthesis GTPase MnmE [Candidatus Saganbacteria bacterium]